MRTFSLRRRIAALVAGTVLATVVVVGVAAWLFTRHYLLNQTDQNLRSVATSAAASKIITRAGLGIGTSGIQQLSLPFQVDSAQAVLTSPQVLPFDGRDAAVAAGTGDSILRTVSIAGKRYRMITVQVPGTTYALQVAQDIEPQETSLHKLALLLVVVGLVGAAGAAVAGVAIARAGLRPVRELTAAAERIARTDELGPPIELGTRENPEDEVARLATAFNAMLAALSQSRDRQRALVADAGHELRTPLTSLRTNIELLAREDPSSGRVLDPADRSRLLADVTAQTAELSSLIGDLTDLAREDSSQSAKEHIDLAEVAERAIDRVRRRAPHVQIVTDMSACPVHGRPRQLERAVTNLLDNAVKWSPPGGEVFVGLHRGELVVADQGPGIADEDLPRIFERFYRATTSREQPGSGLGLAIVAQAAREHRGTVTAGRTPTGGTLMRFTVPVDDSAERPDEPEPVPAG
ncbi:MAG TPA: HAMP domain-containing sensor histidine kinase [Mycobacteriales bacterium]